MTVSTPTAEDTGSALPPGTSQEDLQLPDELRASLSPELAKGLLPNDAPTPDDSEDSDSDDADAPDASGDASPDEEDDDTARDEDPEAAQVEEFVQTLMTNPASISRVPRALQPKVMDSLLSSIADAVMDLRNADVQKAQGEYQRGYQAAKTELIVSAADQLFEDGDLDAFKAYVTKELGSVENYHRLKAGQPPQPTGANAELQTEAETLYREFVTDFPNAEPALREMWQNGGYPMNREGIRKLTRDIERLRVRVESGAGNDPASQELSRRKAAADARSKLPRPPVSNTGTRSAPAITKEWVAAQDPVKLAKMMEDEKFEAKVNEVFARG